MNVLVADDNRSSADALARLLDKEGYSARAVYGGAEAIAALSSDRPEVVLTDLKMEPIDGFEVLKAARALPDPPRVVVFTAFGDVETAMQAMRLGAEDFLMKPVSIEQILTRLAPGEPPQAAASPGAASQDGFVAQSQAARALLGSLELAADVPSPVWLQGEVGSGRTFAARTLHRLAHRTGDFVLLDPLHPPEQWPERGTLLLEKVDDLPAASQDRLRRLLADVPDSVRLVSTASPEAAARAADGRLRQDLFYDLSVLTLNVPPMRQRAEDVVPLFQRAVARLSQRYHRLPPTLAAADLDSLQAHTWPGNLRELLNLAERTVVLGGGALDALRAAPAALATPAATPVAGPTPFSDDFSLSAHMEAVEKDLLQRALSMAGGDRTAAGKLLGVERNTLRYKLNKYKLL